MSKPVEEERQVALKDEEKWDGVLQVSGHKGHSVEYDGVIYPSLSALAREKHVPYAAMCDRLRMGMDLKQALQSNQRNRTIEYAGKVYPSIKALAEEQQRVYSTLKARLERGMSVEEALLNTRFYGGRGYPVEYAGKLYPSLRSLSIEQRIPYQTLRNRLWRGMTVEEALSASGPSIEYGGKTYFSIKSLADELHVPYDRLRSGLKKGMTVEEALQNNRLCRHKGHPVEYAGKLYSSIRSLAKELPIPYHTLLYRLKKGMSVEEALENNRPRVWRGDPIEYAGKTYSNSKALGANNIGIPEPTTNREESIPANADDVFGAQDDGDINTEDEADEAAFIQTM